jgi:pseudaminic acid synthase
MSKVNIENKTLGSKRTYIIAELSANHLFNKDRTMRIVDAIAKSGADALKIQTLTVDSMTIDCERSEFVINHDCPWKGMHLYDLYQKTPLPYEWHAPIFNRCRELGITCFSTPYDSSSLAFLKKFNPPAYKIASFEAVDIPLIKSVAKLGKPVLISTGIAKLEEIDEAVETCYKLGNKNVILLKCTSAYPAPIDQINLKTMVDLKQRYGCLVGLSDHTLGSEIALGAVCLGASVVEKHVTLKRSDGGPDAKFSMEIQEFINMVSQIRNLEKAIGQVDYSLTSDVENNRRAFGRSLFAVKDIKLGDLFSELNVRSIRPGFGLPPKYLDSIKGRTASRNILRGTPLQWNLIE